MVKLFKYDVDDVKIVKVNAAVVVLCLMLGWNLAAARDCVDPYDTECGQLPFPNDYSVEKPDTWSTPNAHGSTEDENWNWNINGEYGDPALRDDIDGGEY